MTVKELTTPFSRKKVIMYSSDGKKAVYHWKNLQNVSGNVYRGETIHEQYNDYCNLFVFYDDITVGMYVCQIRTDYTIDEAMRVVKQNGLDTLENYKQRISERLQMPDHFRFIEIEFSKYIDPSLENQMVESKLRHYEINKQRYEARKLEEKRKEKEYVDSMNEKAYAAVDAAIAVFESGNGIVENSTLTFYKARYSCKSYSILCYLANQYHYDIPIRTQGWINGNLKSFTLNNGYCTSVSYMKPKGGKCCNTIHEHISNLRKIIVEGK